MSLRIRASRVEIGIANLLQPARGAQRRVLPASPKNENPTVSDDTGGVSMLHLSREVAALEWPTAERGRRSVRLPIFNLQFRRSAGFPRNRREIDASK